MAAETAWLCQLRVFLATEAIVFFLPLNTAFYRRHSHWAITYMSHSCYCAIEE